jgi:hypothetical protein
MTLQKIDVNGRLHIALSLRAQCNETGQTYRRASVSIYDDRDLQRYSNGYWSASSSPHAAPQATDAVETEALVSIVVDIYDTSSAASMSPRSTHAEFI